MAIQLVPAAVQDGLLSAAVGAGDSVKQSVMLHLIFPLRYEFLKSPRCCLMYLDPLIEQREYTVMADKR